MVASSHLPILVIFSLDSTLFPFLVPPKVTFPYSLNNDTGEVIDTVGNVFKPYPEAEAILERLKKAGVQMGFTTDSKLFLEATNQLIKLYGWDDYFPLREFHPEIQGSHIVNIHNQTNIPYDKMIYFANWQYNLEDSKKLGTYCVYVEPPNGLTMQIVENALKAYDLRQQ